MTTGYRYKNPINEVYTYVDTSNTALNNSIFKNNPLGSVDYNVSGSAVALNGMVAAGTKSVVIGSVTTDFKVGQGIVLFGCGDYGYLTDPTTGPTLTSHATSGSTTYSYSFVAVNGLGSVTSMSPISSISAASSFAATDYITIVLPTVIGAVGYYLYKKVGNNGGWIPLSGTTFNDYNTSSLLTTSLPFELSNYPTKRNALISSVTGFSTNGLTIADSPNFTGTILFTHDDTAALQSLFDAASLQKKPIQLGVTMNDVFYVSSTVNISSNTIITMCGSIKPSPFISKLNSLLNLSGDQITIRDLIVDCSTSLIANSSFFSISTTSLSNSLLNHITIKNLQYGCLSINGQNVNVTDSFFSGSSIVGQFVGGSSNCRISNSNLQSTSSDYLFRFYGGCCQSGISYCNLNSSNSGSVDVLSDSTQQGVLNSVGKFVTNHEISISNNVINCSGGITIRNTVGSSSIDPYGIVIGGNTIYSAGTAITVSQGISLINGNAIHDSLIGTQIDSPLNSINANTFFNNTTAITYSASNTMIHDNYINNNVSKTYGINCTATSSITGVTVRNNTIINATYPINLNNYMVGTVASPVTTNVVKGNVGTITINGSSPSFSPPATPIVSGTNYTNPYGLTMQVIFYNVTGSPSLIVTQQGQAYPSITLSDGCSFVINPSDSLKITGTVPSWTWIPLY